MSLVESHRPSCPKRRLDKPCRGILPSHMMVSLLVARFRCDWAMFNDLKGNEEQFQEMPYAELLIQNDISKITMARKRFAIRAAGPSQECRVYEKGI
ncbi:hypothetical protein EAE99_009640 [Botrytis elliptica]|nr:hypothetical protein EAE99_009640 [Botrytis elliptica]